MSESTSAAELHRTPGFWESVREAIAGSRQDFTQGSLGRAILLLAVPMILEMVMESIFAIVDVFWVSKLGADAVATVGITESMLAIVYSISLGLSMSAAAMVARRIGERNPDQAAVSAVQAMGLGVAVGLLVGTTGSLLAPKLLDVMGASPQLIATGHRYTSVMLGSSFVILQLFLINAIFRGAGDAAVAMRVLWLANLINLVLDPCLIFGLGPFPALGVTGAAVATTTGRSAGVIFQLVMLARGRGRIAIRREHLQLHLSVMLRLLRLSGTGILQMMIGMVSWLGLVRILSRFGSNALAGYTIGVRIILFALLPSWGMSNAAATLVGQNLGARNPDRAERSVWLAGFYNMCFLGGVGLLFILFAPGIIHLFTSDPLVVPYAVDCLRLVSCGFLFYAYGMVLSQAFNGAGDTLTPTLLNLTCFWLWEIPMAYLLSIHLGLGPHGVFISIAIAYSTFALLGALVFRRGRWKLQVV